MMDDFLSLSSQEQEQAFRQSIRRLFQYDFGLAEANRILLSDDDFAADARRRFIEETRQSGDKTPVEIFDLWVKVMREELQRAC